MVTFKTHDEVLSHFENGGCLLDTFERTVYISDVNLDGEFFGIMVACDVPRSEMSTAEDAAAWAMEHVPAPGAFGAPGRMDLMDAPGGWFDGLARDVLAHPHEFIA